MWTLAVTQERERIAREMHESIDQVLGYVNTKAQAAQELLRAGQPEKAEEQISQLSEVARDAYA
ncbi:MAG: histidine kinase, partial [Chloroflexia bacterium]|nr:histidine kinase [Chloroflexia bacterium]